MSEEAVIHILREARQNEAENMKMAEMLKVMPPCPICGRKAYLMHFIVDGFDFGYGAGCPEYCLDDGIHGISDYDDPRAPKVDGYSAKQAYDLWLEYCERMNKNGLAGEHQV